MEEFAERAELIARYIVETGDTVRGAAKKFAVSKSTVHNDITKRLRRINPTLWRRCGAILAYNKAERHIRGGLATRNKYLTKERYKKRVSV